MRLDRSLAWTAAFLLLLGAVAAPSPARAKKRALRLALPAGETLFYRMELEQEVNIQGMVITVTESGTVEITALETSSDTLHFSVHFRDFEGSLRRGDEFTERTPELNGSTLRCDVLPHGKVTSVQPLQAVRASVQQQLKQLVDNLFPYFAAEPVEPGDTWTEMRKDPNPEDPKGPPGIEGTTEHTLDEFTEKDGIEVAKILSKGKAKVNLNTEAGPVAGDAKNETEALVAVQDGRILDLESRGSFSGTLGVMEGSRGETFRLKLLR